MNSELILAALKYTPEEAYNLAKEKGERIPELEPIIATDPQWAYAYARDVIKGRWPEVETTILENKRYKDTYIRFLFFKNPIAAIYFKYFKK